MRITFMPQTKQSRWSVIMIFIAFIMVILINVIDNYYRMPGNEIPYYMNGVIYPLLAFIALISFVISLVAGLKATLKAKERSILVFICILIDLFALYFAIAQVVGIITGNPG